MTVLSKDPVISLNMIKGNEKTLYKQRGKCEKVFIRHLKHGIGGCNFLCFLKTYRLVLVDIMQRL